MELLTRSRCLAVVACCLTAVTITSCLVRPPERPSPFSHAVHAGVRDLDCSFCHDKHGYIPDCLNCHQVHIEDQKFEDCLKCHQVHNPLQLAYGTEVPNRDCGACHADLRSTLESGATKHARLVGASGTRVD